MQSGSTSLGLSRRALLTCASKAAVATVFSTGLLLRAAEPRRAALVKGAISGEATAVRSGEEVLATGGNAIDAIVAAALVAAVASPHNTGIGGYGGHMTIALAKRKKVTCIDFNSAAPAAASQDMFASDKDDSAPANRGNQFGWLAAGVPGVLAGLQLALDHYGTRSFRESVLPAINLARNGFPLSASLAATIRGCAAQFRADAGSRKLFFRDDQLLGPGDTYNNPDLAAMLTTLAERNSVESFYRGDIAQRIAEAFQKNGGILTAKDLAAYGAREVRPLSLFWRGFDIHTAPLTAGGLTVLQGLGILRALEWDKLPAKFARTHARIEALRWAWHDRLQHLGDPEHNKVPIAKLLSAEYAGEAASQIRQAVKDNKYLPLQTDPRPQGGTIHLSAVDRLGNMAACTFTHGGSFGARVTVEGLGLTLGHGMSRFEPKPGYANSVGPGKRPLHNMCPTIVLQDGHPILALGARGGRKIPNAVFDVLTQLVACDRTMNEAVAAPRLHTEGNLDLLVEKTWAATDVEMLRQIGYRVTNGASAYVSAVSFDPGTAESRAAGR